MKLFIIFLLTALLPSLSFGLKCFQCGIYGDTDTTQPDGDGVARHMCDGKNEPTIKCKTDEDVCIIRDGTDTDGKPHISKSCYQGLLASGNYALKKPGCKDYQKHFKGTVCICDKDNCNTQVGTPDVTDIDHPITVDTVCQTDVNNSKIVLIILIGLIIERLLHYYWR